MMNSFLKSLLIFSVFLLVACNKEKPAEPQTAAKADAPILKEKMEALNHAEDATKAAKEALEVQKKQLDDATQ
jgi:outer membrane biogenesis lipoprotein LolB